MGLRWIWGKISVAAQALPLRTATGTTTLPNTPCHSSWGATARGGDTGATVLLLSLILPWPLGLFAVQLHTWSTRGWKSRRALVFEETQGVLALLSVVWGVVEKEPQLGKPFPCPSGRCRAVLTAGGAADPSLPCRIPAAFGCSTLEVRRACAAPCWGHTGRLWGFAQRGGR